VVECGRWARGRRPPSVRMAARTEAESGAEVAAAAAGHAPAGIEHGGGAVVVMRVAAKRNEFAAGCAAATATMTAAHQKAVTVMLRGRGGRW
jgi:hypothetical protein